MKCGPRGAWRLELRKVKSVLAAVSATALLLLVGAAIGAALLLILLVVSLKVELAKHVLLLGLSYGLLVSSWLL